MLFNEVTPIFEGDNFFLKILIIAAGLFFGGILLYIIIHPYIRSNKAKSILVHSAAPVLPPIEKPSFANIAVALDFSVNDSKVLSYAIGQGHAGSTYTLLHIVESASAKLLGKESDDYETRKDIEQLQAYITQLREQGISAKAEIGYRDRVKEIVRIVKESNADILVIGAHGHTGMKDFIYGATVNAVRHELKIPVLVVTL